MNREIISLPEASEYSILSALEKSFFKLVGWDYDKELSIELIGHLKNLYGDTQSAIGTINSFIDRNSEKIEEVYRRYKKENDHPILLYQPEAFIIFERLDNDEFKLKRVWTEKYDFDTLQDIARCWGKALE